MDQSVDQDQGQGFERSEGHRGKPYLSVKTLPDTQQLK